MALLPERIVAERYGKHIRTLKRWDQTPGLGFPPPIVIRKRRYRDADAIAAWEKAQAAKSAGKAA
jgi:regulator of protease activity HflC (stomatin/prohibitin superfamily)